MTARRRPAPTRIARADAAIALALAAAVLVAGLTACGRDAPPSSENVARERFVRDLAAREGMTDLWRLMSRGDLVFEEGWSRMLLVEPDPDRPWIEVSRTDASVRAMPVRWIGPSAHLRVRGGADMHLRVWGKVDRQAIFTRPRVSLTVGGIEIASRLVDEDGRFVVETVIPAGWVARWTDVYLQLSSVGEPWRDPAATRVARVEGVVWDAVP